MLVQTAVYLVKRPGILAGGVVLACVFATLGWWVGRDLLSDDSRASKKGAAHSARNALATPSMPASRDGRPDPTAAEPLRRPVLVDVAELVGVRFTYYSDSRTDRFFLPEVMGGGAAWLDYDGDGWLDLFIPQGCVLPESVQDTDHWAKLFRNIRGVEFAEVSLSAGADDRGYGQGACVGDYNNDGFPDLYVTHYGANRLLTNNGDGTFIDQAVSARVGSGGWSTSCAFGDLDRDGDLDLYLCHYTPVSLDKIPVCLHPRASGHKVRIYCGPDQYPGEADNLYCNLGDGTFADVTEEAGCNEPEGRGLAVVFADLDDNGWPDVFVANDMDRNFLFWNLGDLEPPSGSGIRLKEDAVRSGVALTGTGRPVASMGIACADYDRNGRLDLFVTNYWEMGYVMYQNVGQLFVDQSSGANVFLPTIPYLGFGTGFLDYDNDGWWDLLVTNGHVLGPLIGPPDRMRGQVFHNVNGRYEEVTDWAGPYFYQDFFGRGLALADFTNAGATGALVVHRDEPAALLRNDTPARGHYLGLHLVGTRANRCALNTRVVASVNGTSRTLETVGGGSYLSDSDHRLLLGLDDASRVERLEIHWPSGAVDQWTDLAADRYLLLVEGFPPRLAPYESGVPD